MRRLLERASTPFGDSACSDAGDGPAALFIHGVFLNRYLRRHVTERVDLRRCIALDLLAHGHTRTPSDQDVSLEAQAEMLAAFCDALDLERVDVVAAVALRRSSLRGTRSASAASC